MNDNFKQSLQHVLKHEGGYVNHPRDPGGATNKGITWRTYNAYRTKRGQPTRDVREITDHEVATIYKIQYWDTVKGDRLPSGVDYAVFDFAVNSGPARAAKFLQSIVGVTADGVIGEQTLAAVSERDPSQVVVALCDSRLAWMKRLKTWSTFGRGWTNRVQGVISVAFEMAKSRPLTFTSPAPAPHKASGPEKASATISDALKRPESLTAIGGAVGSVAAMANGDGPVQYAIAACFVAAVLAGIYLLVKKSGISST